MLDFDPTALGSRFRFQAWLGDPTGSSVMRCFDQVLEREVAVKLLPRGEDTAELRVIPLLTHPGIVDVLDVGRSVTGGRAWFSMALLEGEPFGAEGCRPTARRSWARRVARLLEAMAFLHDRGWIHGRLQPESALVLSEGLDRVVLLGLGSGLARSRVRARPPTPGYVAPEVLGGARPSFAADLYSLGVLAATAATGGLPFPADDPHPGLASGPPGYWLGPELTPGARAWLGGMLQRSPARRPATARKALAALEEAIGEELADPTDTATRLTPAPLLGRTELLLELEATCRDGGLAIVLGPPASGRTAVLRAHLDRARSHGSSTTLVDLGQDGGRAQRALRYFLADQGSSLLVPPQRDTFTSPGSWGDALRAYEAALSADLREVVDSSSTCLLLDHVSADTTAGRAILRALTVCDTERGLVLTADDTDADAYAELLQARSDPRDSLVRLTALGLDQIEVWLGHSLGAVSRAGLLAAHLRETSGGLPGRLHEATTLLLEEGVIRPDEREWTWSPALLADTLRLGRNTAPQGLRALDVAGLVSAALVDAEALDQRGEVRAAYHGLARALGRAERVSAAPPALAPGWRALADLSLAIGDGDQAISWLRRAREAVQEDPEAVVSTLVREAEALGVCGRWEAVMELLTGEAERLERDGSPPDRARAAALAGGALLRLGRISEAQRRVEEAYRELGGTVPLRNRIALLLLAAEADWRQGRYPRATAACRAAMEVLPATATGTLRASVESALASSLRLQGRFEDAAGLYHKAVERYRAAGRLLDEARVASDLGVVHYRQGDWLAAIEAFEAFRELVRRSGDVEETASAWNTLGCLYRDTGLLDRAEDAFDRSLELARRHRLRLLEPTVLGNLAECSATRGRASLAEGQYAECAAVAEDQGLPHEVALSWRRRAQLRLDAGYLDAATEAVAAARAIGAASQTVDEALILEGLSAVIAVAGGDPAGLTSAEFAITRLEEAGAAFEAARLRLRLASAMLAVDRYGDAEEHVGIAVRVCEPLPAQIELAWAEELRQLIAAATRNRLDAVTAHYDALQQLTLAISRERDLPVLLETILERTLALVGEDRGYVVLLDEGGEPTLQVTRHLDPGTVARQFHGSAETVTRRVIETRSPLAALDLSRIEGADELQALDADVHSVICVPILRADLLLGLIYVDGRTAVGGSAETKASLLMACADAASVAIENARLIEALRLKNDAIAIMAHELRTPLSSIVGFASLMLQPEGIEEGETEELLGIIKREAERTAELVNQVLQLARMEAGQVEVRRETVDPIQIVVAGADTLRPLARQANVKLLPDASDDVPDVLGDEDRLVQVAVNLLGNAVKFSPPEGEVRITAERAPDGGLLLRVVDQGPGIPEDRITSIFEPYKQAGPRGMRARGVGLGLAVCRQIVRQHGGWVRAENRPEGGARFTVWLPAATDPPE